MRNERPQQSAQPLAEHGLLQISRGQSEPRFSALSPNAGLQGQVCAPGSAGVSPAETRARRDLILAFSHQGLAALRFIAAADRPPLIGDGHSHRLAPVV